MCEGQTFISTVFQETYPSTPPVWFAESEETSVTNAVSILSNTTGLDNHMTNQVQILLRELCRIQGLPEPPDIHQLQLSPQSLGNGMIIEVLYNFCLFVNSDSG